MLALCIVALVVAVASMGVNFYLYRVIKNHYGVWDTVTDNIIAQSHDVFQNHANRIAHMELSVGGIYTPFGYQKSKKA